MHGLAIFEASGVPPNYNVPRFKASEDLRRRSVAREGLRRSP